MDCSAPGSSIHGIFQARVLEWVTISFSRISSWPRYQSRSPATQADVLPSEPPRERHLLLLYWLHQSLSLCGSTLFLLEDWASGEHGDCSEGQVLSPQASAIYVIQESLPRLPSRNTCGSFQNHLDLCPSWTSGSQTSSRPSFAGALIKIQILAPTSTFPSFLVSDSVDLRWGLRVCISKAIHSVTKAVVLEVRHSEPQLQINWANNSEVRALHLCV